VIPGSNGYQVYAFGDPIDTNEQVLTRQQTPFFPFIDRAESPDDKLSDPIFDRRQGRFYAVAIKIRREAFGSIILVLQHRVL
jgi:hypothetical protein